MGGWDGGEIGGGKGAPSQMTTCWIPAPSTNLALQTSMLSERRRCEQRHETLEQAQAACVERSWCRGVSRDAELKCGETRPTYELRTGAKDEPVWLEDGRLHHDALHAPPLLCLHRLHDANADMFDAQAAGCHRRGQVLLCVLRP